MEEEQQKPTTTPRKRRSFGMRDLRRVWRQAGTDQSLKTWARKARPNRSDERLPLSAKVQRLLPR